MNNTEPFEIDEETYELIEGLAYCFGLSPDEFAQQCIDLAIQDLTGPAPTTRA